MLMAVLMASNSMTSSSGAVRRFFITRHGETTWNAAERLQGTTDQSTLTPKGELQAQELGQRLFAEEAGEIGAVFCSSLGRARQTHAIVQAHFAAQGGAALPAAFVTPELREIELRRWEGRLKNELATGAEAAEWRAWKQRPSDFAFDDGFYPLRELMRRAERCWREILMVETPETDCATGALAATDQPRGATLVIAHGGLNRALLIAALGLPMESFAEARFNFGNCAWLELEVGAAGPDAVRWRWRHPGPASAWRTARQERALAAKGQLVGARSGEDSPAY